MKRTERFFPENLTERITLIEYGIEVAYSAKNLSAIFYAGKSLKSTWYYRFKDETRMMEVIHNSINSYVKQQNDKREQRDAQKRLQETLRASDHFQVGDIIVNTWGWEQTNVYFYQITEVLNKKIRVKEICKKYEETGFMSGSSLPVKDHFVEDGEQYLLSLKYIGESVYICNPESYYYFHKWSGRKEYESHYA